MMRTGNSHAGRVNLTKYVKLRGAASEKWRFCPVVRTGNGRIRPDYVLIDGRPELHQEGAYYIEWYLDGRRYRESVGKNPSEAFASAERKAQVLRNQTLGIEIVGADKATGATLAEACREFLEETRQHHRPKTYSQYKTALEYFRQSCREKPLCSVQRTDVMSFMGFLSDRGLARRTIWTKVQVVVSMLKANGVTKLIRKRDWPRYTETEPEVYTAEEVERFLAQCNSWKRVLFEFFWMTGFREGEVMYDESDAKGARLRAFPPAEPAGDYLFEIPPILVLVLINDQPLLQVTQIQLNSACLSKPSILSKSRS